MIGRSTDETCPYLGYRFDSTLRCTGPDPDNRCYARFRRVRVLWLFREKRPGAWIDLEIQGSTCYGDYRTCSDFRTKASEGDRDRTSERER